MASPRPGHGFIRGAHFFGSASPLNFWDTFRAREVDPFLQQLQDDGFNAVLLVLPWAQFQPSVSPPRYDQALLSRLEAIMDAAARRGLGVILRLGFLWEAKPLAEQTFRRYAEYAQREDIRLAWRDYLQTLHRLVQAHEAFRFAFLSWEDFYWPIFSAGSAGAEHVRQQRARDGGFTAYLQRRFSLDGLNGVYQTNFESWDAVAIPTPAEFLFEQYTRFYENELLDPICCAAAESFPGIRMEKRVDAEWIQSPEGLKFYHWSMNFPGASTKVIYYHAQIGMAGGQVHELDAAVAHLRDLLAGYCRMAEIDEKKPFIDQFNFFDDTHAEWARISDQALPDFVEASYDVLSKFSSGYAIWGYRDWPKDILYNGAFELGGDGWSLADGATIAACEPTAPGPNCLRLGEGQSASRDACVLSLAADEPRVVAVSGRALHRACTLLVQLDGHGAEIVLTGDAEQVATVSLQGAGAGRLVIRALDGSAEISKLQLYDRIRSQGFRTLDGGSRPAVEAFRLLNLRLGAD